MLTLFEQALIMHLIGDWVLQNHWMAINKSNLKHPAAWVHMAIHVLLMAFVFGWLIATLLGIVHMLIDTRIPFKLWRRFFRMTDEGPAAMHVQIWTDQVFHVLCIAACVQYLVPNV